MTPEQREKRRESARRWAAENRKKHPEKCREYQRQWWIRNRDKSNNYSRKQRLENAAQIRNHKRRHRLKKLYGLTEDKLTQLVLLQDNKCGICRQSLTYTNIDHCHKTGKVRGILCPECNLGLGKFKDSPQRLRAAAEYLEKSNA